MKRIVLIQIFFLTINIFSQADSIESALKFYPINIGDYWQYKVLEHMDGSASKDTSWFGSKEVVADTIMPNGKNYFVVKEEGLPNKFIAPLYIRIDSSTGKVYNYFSGDVIMDNLLAEEGDEVIAGYRCMEETTKTFFGFNVKTKLIEQYFVSSTTYDGWELAYNFGEVMRYYNDVGFVADLFQCNLIYAKLNGVEYGVKVDVRKTIARPEQLILFQNFPNPFNPTTTFKFILPVSDKIKLTVYNSLGEEITTLINGFYTSGEHQIKWNAINIPSGVYFLRLQTSKHSITKKALLLK